DVLANILTTEPDWDALPADTPPRIRELLLRCLQKDPARRVRDVGDARIDIEETLAESPAESRVRSGPSRPVSEPITPPPQAPRRRSVVPIAAVFLIGVAAFGIWSVLRPRAISRLPDRKYLAVLPFKDLSGVPGGQLVGDG